MVNLLDAWCCGVMHSRRRGKSLVAALLAAAGLGVAELATLTHPMQHRARSTRLARIVRGLGSVEIRIDELLLPLSRSPVAIDNLDRAHAVRVIRVLVTLRQRTRLRRVRRPTGDQHGAERARVRPAHTPPPDRASVSPARLTHEPAASGHDDLVRLSNHQIPRLAVSELRRDTSSNPPL